MSVAWEAWERERRRADNAEWMLARAVMAAGGEIRIEAQALTLVAHELELERSDDVEADAIVLKARRR